MDFRVKYKLLLFYQQKSQIAFDQSDRFSATSQMIKAVRGLDLKKENMHGPRTTRNRSRTGQFSSFNLSHMD